MVYLEVCFSFQVFGDLLDIFLLLISFLKQNKSLLLKILLMSPFSSIDPYFDSIVIREHTLYYFNYFKLCLSVLMAHVLSMSFYSAVLTSVALLTLGELVLLWLIPGDSSK